MPQNDQVYSVQTLLPESSHTLQPRKISSLLQKNIVAEWNNLFISNCIISMLRFLAIF